MTFFQCDSLVCYIVTLQQCEGRMPSYSIPCHLKDTSVLRYRSSLKVSLLSNQIRKEIVSEKLITKLIMFPLCNKNEKLMRWGITKITSVLHWWILFEVYQNLSEEVKEVSPSDLMMAMAMGSYTIEFTHVQLLLLQLPLYETSLISPNTLGQCEGWFGWVWGMIMSYDNYGTGCLCIILLARVSEIDSFLSLIA